MAYTHIYILKGTILYFCDIPILSRPVTINAFVHLVSIA